MIPELWRRLVTSSLFVGESSTTIQWNFGTLRKVWYKRVSSAFCTGRAYVGVTERKQDNTSSSHNTSDYILTNFNMVISSFVSEPNTEFRFFSSLQWVGRKYKINKKLQEQEFVSYFYDFQSVRR